MTDNVGVMSIGTLICDSEADTYLTKRHVSVQLYALYNYIDNMYEDKTKNYRKLRETI